MQETVVVTKSQWQKSGFVLSDTLLILCYKGVQYFFCALQCGPQSFSTKRAFRMKRFLCNKGWLYACVISLPWWACWTETLETRFHNRRGSCWVVWSRSDATRGGRREPIGPRNPFPRGARVDATGCTIRCVQSSIRANKHGSGRALSWQRFRT